MVKLRHYFTLVNDILNKEHGKLALPLLFISCTFLRTIRGSLRSFRFLQQYYLRAQQFLSQGALRP